MRPRVHSDTLFLLGLWEHIWAHGSLAVYLEDDWATTVVRPSLGTGGWGQGSSAAAVIFANCWQSTADRRRLMAHQRPVADCGSCLRVFYDKMAGFVPLAIWHSDDSFGPCAAHSKGVVPILDCEVKGPRSDFLFVASAVCWAIEILALTSAAPSRIARPLPHLHGGSVLVPVFEHEAVVCALRPGGAELGGRTWDVGFSTSGGAGERARLMNQFL